MGGTGARASSRTKLGPNADSGAAASSIHRRRHCIKLRLGGRILTLRPAEGIVEALQGCSVEAVFRSCRAEIIPAGPDPDNAGEGNESCVLTADVSRRTAIAPPGRRAVFVIVGIAEHEPIA